MERRHPGWFTRQDARLLVRYTRHWLHYGVITFTVLCSVIAALRGAVAP